MFLPSGWWLGTWWCRALSGNNLCLVRCLARLDMPLSNVPVLQKRCEPVWRGAQTITDRQMKGHFTKTGALYEFFTNVPKPAETIELRYEKWMYPFAFLLCFGLFNGTFISLVAQKHIHCAFKRTFLLTSRALHEHNSTCSKYVKILKWGKTKVICWSYPGTPPASMWLARVTSCDQTSYCHFWRPITPQRTFPEWTPTRMFMSTPVASLTFLK